MTIESGPQRRTERQETTPTTPARETAELDKLLAELTPQPPTVEQQTAQAERNRVALETVVPFVQQYKQLFGTVEGNVKMKDFNLGQKEYAALIDDEDAYRQIYQPEREAYIEGCHQLKELYAKAVEKYYESGGVGDLTDAMPYGQYQAQIYENNVHEENSPYLQKKDGTRTDRAGQQFEYLKEVLATKPKILADERPNSPREVFSAGSYVYKLKQAALTLAERWGRETRGQKGTLAAELDYFAVKPAGFGMAALEHGDMEIAAQVFELVDAVGATTPELLEQMRHRLSKLGPDQVKAFADALGSARSENLKAQLERRFAGDGH